MVARRAHNPKVVGSNPASASAYPDGTIVIIVPSGSFWDPVPYASSDAAIKKRVCRYRNIQVTGKAHARVIFCVTAR